MVSHIEAAIDRQQSKEPLRCTHLMELLIEFRAGDAPTQAARAKASAERAAARADFETARRFWSLASRLFKVSSKMKQTAKRPKPPQQRRTFRRPIFSRRQHHRTMGSSATILAWRSSADKWIGGHKARIDELHARLEAAQPHSMDQMKITASGPIELNLGPAVALVRGKSLLEVLRNLAASYQPISASGLRRTVESDVSRRR